MLTTKRYKPGNPEKDGAYLGGFDQPIKQTKKPEPVLFSRVFTMSRAASVSLPTVVRSFGNFSPLTTDPLVSLECYYRLLFDGYEKCACLLVVALR